MFCHSCLMENFGAILSIVFIIVHKDVHAGTLQSYRLENVTSFLTELHEHPTLFFELDIHVQFPIDACCPMIAISVYKYNDMFPENCFANVQQYTNWFKNSVFETDIGKQENANIHCELNTTSRLVSCDIFGVIDQDYEPKQRWFVIGYPCKQIKTMHQFHLWIDIQKEVNETICEPTVALDFPGNKLKCQEFYNYTSLPNIFGDIRQEDAARVVDFFHLYFNSVHGKFCHKYLMQYICMIFLPRCPFDSREKGNGVDKHQPLTADHLIPICREAAFQLLEACFEEISPLITLLSTTTLYFPEQNGTTACHFKRVRCSVPPAIENGQAILLQRDAWYAKDVVFYICDKNYEASQKNFSTCTFSGNWTESPTCKDTRGSNKKEITIVLVTVAAVLIIAGLLVFTYLRKRRVCCGVDNNFVPRNRPYDIFISYESGEKDEEFVRNEICKKLDKEYGGKYRLLIHQRDFHAGTLIMANIQYAVRDTNCAVVLLSQKYIRSRWCVQEFEECMEEASKDPSYGLVVILMQEMAILKQETLSPYMKTYLRNRTYLEVTDPKLWQRLESIQHYQTPP